MGREVVRSLHPNLVVFHVWRILRAHGEFATRNQKPCPLELCLAE